MSVFSEITRIKAAKEAIRAAIEEKGVSVGDGTLDTYADKIGEIEVGGGDEWKARYSGLMDGSLTELVIPTDISEIKSYRFYGFWQATGDVIIPDNVKSIGAFAFGLCKGITSFTIPYGVTSIAIYTFYQDSSLTSVTIPDSVTSILDYAFAECTSLASITIPNGVTSLGRYALNIGGASAKATIIMKPTTPPTIQSNSIGANVEKIIVPAASLNAYLNATNWAAYASIIEANSEDVPVERWIINGTPVIDNDYIYDIAFSSMNEIFNGIYLSMPTAIAYSRADQDLGSASAYDEATGWYDQAYRTVDFYEHPTGGLLAWLQENAVQIAETWVLDKNTVPILTDEAGRSIHANVRFLSNDSTFDNIDGGSGDLYYDTTLACTIDPPEWISEEYKTLHLMESPVDDDFINWLQTNGTKQ